MTSKDSSWDKQFVLTCYHYELEEVDKLKQNICADLEGVTPWLQEQMSCTYKVNMAHEGNRRKVVGRAARPLPTQSGDLNRSCCFIPFVADTILSVRGGRASAVGTEKTL